jgi:hypothetical protein
MRGCRSFKQIIISVVATAGLVICGCSRETGTETTENTHPGFNIDSTVDYNWKEKGFNFSADIDFQQLYWPKEYISDTYESVVSTDIYDFDKSDENHTVLTSTCEGNLIYFYLERNDDLPTQSLYMENEDGDRLGEYHCTGGEYIGSFFQMDTGELVFRISDSSTRKSKLVYFEPDNFEEKILLKDADLDILYSTFVSHGNYIYYQNSDGIVGWNIASGERAVIYPITGDFTFSDLVFDESELSELKMYNSDGYWRIPLSNEEVFKNNTVTIAALTTELPKVVSQCISNLNIYDPETEYKLVSTKGVTPENFRINVINEITAGGGPDILYVDAASLEGLKSAGMIKELDELIPKDLRDSVLKGVIESGTIDGSFVGMAPEMNYDVEYTCNDIWDKDTWTTEEFLDVIENGCYQGLFCEDVHGGCIPFAPMANIVALTTSSFTDEKLIDLDDRACHFDGDHFKRMLEFSLKYGYEYTSNQYKESDYIGYVGKDGWALCLNYGLKEAPAMYEKYGEDLVFVGYPCNTGSGNYIRCEGFLVVNMNSTQNGSIRKFFEELLSDRVQYMKHVPLSFHEADNSVLIPREEDIQTFVAGDGKTYTYWHQIPLYIKENGDTNLSDHIKILESCEPYPKGWEPIIDIIREETPAYFEGGKSVEETAEVIQSRKYLYLSENEWKLY